MRYAVKTSLKRSASDRKNVSACSYCAIACSRGCILRAQPLTLSERLECRDVLAIPIERRPQRLDPDFYVLAAEVAVRALPPRDTFQADRR